MVADARGGEDPAEDLAEDAEEELPELEEGVSCAAAAIVIGEETGDMDIIFL